MDYMWGRWRFKRRKGGLSEIEVWVIDKKTDAGYERIANPLSNNSVLFWSWEAAEGASWQ